MLKRKLYKYQGEQAFLREVAEAKGYGSCRGHKKIDAKKIQEDF